MAETPPSEGLPSEGLPSEGLPSEGLPSEGQARPRRRVDDAAGLPLVVVSVGTDHHRFDRLVGWMDSWAGDHPDAKVVIQRGRAGFTRHAESHAIVPYPELRALFADATVVVSHGGPSTVMDARSVGRLPIVVPRDPAHGEHVDDHQLRFSRHLAGHGMARLARSRAELYETVDEAMDEPDRFRVDVSDEARPGVVSFGQVVDQLIGIGTDLTAPPRRPWRSR